MKWEVFGDMKKLPFPNRPPHHKTECKEVSSRRNDLQTSGHLAI